MCDRDCRRARGNSEKLAAANFLGAVHNVVNIFLHSRHAGKPVAWIRTSLKAGAHASTKLPRRRPPFAKKLLVHPPASSINTSPANTPHPPISHPQSPST